MRIDHDTASFSGSQLTHSHHHHITKCHFEEQETKKMVGAIGERKDVFQTSALNNSKAEGSPVGIGANTDRRSGRFKIGKGFVREIWDSMGEEGRSPKEGVLPLHDRTESTYDRGTRRVSAALSAIRQDISYYIVNKWEAAKEKIRTGIHSSLKRFGRGKEGFAMLSDAGHQADGREGTKDWKREEEQKGTRAGKEEIPTAYQPDNHLMDSYSKNGEYCRLNENL